MLQNRWIYRQILLLSISLFFMTLNACGPTGGAIDTYWDKGSPPPSHNPYAKYEDKKNGPPAHAPAHGYRAKHHYRYYPEHTFIMTP